jgi:hypothetical protein
MMTSGERRLFTIVFLVLVLLAAYEEYLFARSKFDVWAFAWLVISAILLAGPTQIFHKIVQKMFLNVGLTTQRLHELSSERNRILAKTQGPRRDEYADTAELVTTTLKYAEAWLNGWAKGTHFELSVFIDQEFPVVFAYFDSNRDTTSRGWEDRRKNPKYYREADYEVVRVFDNRSSVPHIVSDTKKSRYAFISRNQESQIRSTILLYADVNVQCILVITSNKIKAFRDKDRELMLFIQYIAETVLYDIRQSDIVGKVRTLKPELFLLARN